MSPHLCVVRLWVCMALRVSNRFYIQNRLQFDPVPIGSQRDGRSGPQGGRRIYKRGEIKCDDSTLGATAGWGAIWCSITALAMASFSLGY